MGRSNSYMSLKLPCVWIVALTISTSFVVTDSVQAVTASIGKPYHGRLVNGIPFPNQFDGYNVRDEDRAYSTPELIGALLDALDAVRRQDPGSADLFIGDFSRQGGGGMTSHRSHQNGRDVDLGMYAKGNRPLNTFLPMNGENLDVPKTWTLIENLIRSQRVQYIFLDKRIQNLLYDYALCRGVDATYLDHLFGSSSGSIIQHMRNHQDHIHVRFYAPWSTMAAQVGEGDEQKRMIIEMAQQAYLPKKVNYYVKGTEPSLDALAQSFGVNRKDLNRWNQLHGNESPRPGSCIVFYKRGFEVEPVHLAQSLQPNAIPETPVVQLASLRSFRTASDAPISIRNSIYREKRQDQPLVSTYKVRKGETLQTIAKKNGMTVKALSELNGVGKKGALKPGQSIKVANSKSHLVITEDRAYSVPARTCDPRKVQIDRPLSVAKGDRSTKAVQVAQNDRTGKSNKVLTDAAPASAAPGKAKAAASKSAASSKKKPQDEKAAKRTSKETPKAASVSKTTSKSAATSASSKSKASVSADKKAVDSKKNKGTELAKSQKNSKEPAKKKTN